MTALTDPPASEGAGGRQVEVVRLGRAHEAGYFAEVLTRYREQAERRYGRTAPKHRSKKRRESDQDPSASRSGT